MEHRTKM